jgi:[acyl-carrier-protein] S-malonyltransferase
MVKAAFLFPGQGAQYVGMGKELYHNFPAAKRVFDQAGEILHMDIAKLCFEGPEAQLTATNVCQPAILTMSLACAEVLKQECPEIEMTAAGGLSLGEFTALTIAGGLKVEDALKVVQARGQYMYEACLEKPGTMASVLGMDYDALDEVCKSVNGQFPVNVANVNCPGQIVISGSKEGVRLASEAAKQKGAKRIIELQVSGAFHSSLMISAKNKLRDFLSNISIQSPRVTFISNVLGKAVEKPDEIRELLVRQVTDSVLWQQGVQDLIAKGNTLFIEVGCGKVLSGLQKKISSETRIIRVEDIATLNEVKSFVSPVVQG